MRMARRGGGVLGQSHWTGQDRSFVLTSSSSWGGVWWWLLSILIYRMDIDEQPIPPSTSRPSIRAPGQPTLLNINANHFVLCTFSIMLSCTTNADSMVSSWPLSFPVGWSSSSTLPGLCCNSVVGIAVIKIKCGPHPTTTTTNALLLLFLLMLTTCNHRQWIVFWNGCGL